jgi:hypothetical protein
MLLPTVCEPVQSADCNFHATAIGYSVLEKWAARLSRFACTCFPGRTLASPNMLELNMLLDHDGYLPSFACIISACSAVGLKAAALFRQKQNPGYTGRNADRSAEATTMSRFTKSDGRSSLLGLRKFLLVNLPIIHRVRVLVKINT